MGPTYGFTHPDSNPSCEQQFSFKSLKRDYSRLRVVCFLPGKFDLCVRCFDVRVSARILPWTAFLERCCARINEAANRYFLRCLNIYSATAILNACFFGKQRSCLKRCDPTPTITSFKGVQRRVTVNPIKLETGLRPNSAGIPYTLLLRIEAMGFPTFGLLL